jgi:predicted ATP-binding protein involved in virulence
VDWFVYTSLAKFDRQIRGLEEEFMDLYDDKPYESFIMAVSTSVESALKPQIWNKLRFSYEKQALVIRHHEHGELKVEQLSDGFRNIIAMVADIAYRCIRLNPHLSQQAPKETEGIVLIDEVDMHLHPSWQQTIMPNIQQAFPRIQFIVTTHSPQVISTVDKKNIRLIQKHWNEKTQSWCFESVTPVFQTKGVASYEALAHIMGIDPVPDVEEARWLADYHQLIQSNNYGHETACLLRKKLEQHFGKAHPELLECDRLIRLMDMKKKFNKKAGKNA